MKKLKEKKKIILLFIIGLLLLGTIFYIFNKYNNTNDTNKNNLIKSLESLGYVQFDNGYYLYDDGSISFYSFDQKIFTKVYSENEFIKYYYEKNMILYYNKLGDMYSFAYVGSNELEQEYGIMIADHVSYNNETGSHNNFVNHYMRIDEDGSGCQSGPYLLKFKEDNPDISLDIQRLYNFMSEYNYIIIKSGNATTETSWYECDKYIHFFSDSGLVFDYFPFEAYYTQMENNKN